MLLNLNKQMFYCVNFLLSLNKQINKEFFMLKTTTSPLSVATSHADPYYPIKQQMAAIGTGTVGLKDGNYPFVIDENFLEGEIVLPSGEKRHLKATTLTAVNQFTVDKINLVTAIKEGRFTSFRIKNELITSVSLHHHWTDKMEQENTFEIAIRSRIDMDYRVPNESEDIALSPMEEEEYLNMINVLGFNAFLRV